MALTFLQLAEKVLAEAGQAQTCNEIWATAVRLGYDRLAPSSGKTPWATLGARLYVDIRDNPLSKFYANSDRPKRFALKGSNFTDTPTTPTRPTTAAAPDYKEANLHPLMAYYGHFFLKAHLLTIRHNQSIGKTFKEWIHPDLVGVYYPFPDFEKEVIEMGAAIGVNNVRIFSFELKKELTFGNLRESFFQAVSNSSWANEGYLAAASIDPDVDFRDELRRLSGSFGIGIIQLNTEDPDASEVIFPAQTRETLDWEMMNKLARINPDFKKFLERVRTDIVSKEARKEKFDPIMDREALIKSLTG